MQTSITRRISLALLVAAAILSACDSNKDEEPTDIQTLVGTWAITGFFDDSGDRSDIIANGYAGVHLEFGDTGTGAFEIFPKHGPARLLPITYTVDDEVDLITLAIDLSIDPSLSLELTYIFDVQTESARFHTTHSDALNTIFGSDLTGAVQVIASKFGEEGVPEE